MNSGFPQTATSTMRMPDSKRNAQPTPSGNQTYTLGVLGPGRAGTALAAYLSTHPDVRVLGCALGSQAHQQRFLQCNPAARVFATVPELVAQCDVVVIAVADSAIASVCDAMVHECQTQQIELAGRIVVHLSGATAASALNSAARAGASTAALHPIQAMSTVSVQSRQQAIATLKPVTFSVQSDASTESNANSTSGATAASNTSDSTAAPEHPASAWCRAILEALGNQVVTLPATAKPLYHAATSVAANLSMALFQSAVLMFEQCGFDETQARRALAPLILTNAQSWAEQGMSALTGPVSRNDWTTIASHQQAIESCIKASKERDIHRLYPIYTMLTEQLQDLYNPQD